MARRRALLVGIDDYPTMPLTGCVNDAKAMSALLARNEDGSLNFDVRLLTSEDKTDPINRVRLREALKELFAAPDADVALLYFAGHGVITSNDGYLVTVDAEQYDQGVSLTEVLAEANSSKAHEVVIILDSCMSGALGQVPATGSHYVQLNEGVAVLTSSRSTQPSTESNGRGLFTVLVCGALEGGGADVLGQVTVASVYAYVEEALGPWEQRPLFKANVAKLEPLRTVRPAVPLEVLRELPKWFPNVSDVFPLDPSYEDQVPGFDPEHVKVFKKLQKCCSAKLVDPVDAEHMYFAAINSTGCRLTSILGTRVCRPVAGG